MDDPKRSEEEQREEEEEEASDLDLPEKDAEQAQGGMVSRSGPGDEGPEELRRR